MSAKRPREFVRNRASDSVRGGFNHSINEDVIEEGDDISSLELCQ